MSLIELECPQCAALLELDRGFVGGVCRCSQCGTLMTVPESADRTPPELVTRPPRPESPPPRPAAAAAPSPPRQPVVYRTASGRSIRFAGDVPVARRRRTGVRITTGAAFLLMLAAVLAVCAYAVLLVLTEPDEDRIDADAVTLATLGYDPQANPYTMQPVNVLGLPLGPDRTAVVVDASGSSRSWLALVQAALIDGLVHVASHGGEVVIVFAAEQHPVALSPQYTDPTLLTRRQLGSFMESIHAGGVAALDEAIIAALDTRPERLIVVTGRDLDGAPLARVSRSLQGVRFDAVAFTSSPQRLDSLAGAHGGRVVTLTAGQLQRWHEESARANNE